MSGEQGGQADHDADRDVTPRHRSPETYGSGANAGPAGTGITLAEALNSAASAHRDTTRLIRMLTVLGRNGDVDEILERTLYSLSELFELDAVVALVPGGPGQLRLSAECGLGEDLAEQAPVWPIDPTLATAITSLAPVHAFDADVRLPAVLDELHVREVLWLPGGGDELVILGLLRSSHVHLDASSIEVLRSVGNRLGIALENARHGRRIELLGRLGRTMSAHLDPDHVLMSALEELPDIFAADTTTVALLQDDGDVLFPERYGTGAAPGHRQAAESLVAGMVDVHPVVGADGSEGSGEPDDGSDETSAVQQHLDDHDDRDHDECEKHTLNDVFVWTSRLQG